MNITVHCPVTSIVLCAGMQLSATWPAPGAAAFVDEGHPVDLAVNWETLGPCRSQDLRCSTIELDANSQSSIGIGTFH